MQPHEQERFEEFWSLNAYVDGNYDDREGFVRLENELTALEKGRTDSNRIFYLALPPFIYQRVTIHIKELCLSEQ